MIKRWGKLTIIDSQVPLSEADIHVVEARLNISFPSDYRQFLLTYNGGVPKPDNFHFKNENRPYTDSCVARFYAIYEGQLDSLENVFRLCKAENLLPDHIIAIADDPGGNMICLSISGPDTNSVYLWDHENIDKDDKGTNLHLIADSFAEFLACLEESPEYVVPVFDEILLQGNVEDLKAIIASGWNVKTLHEGRQDLPVETAALYGKPEFVEVLLQHGAKTGRALDIAERGIAMPQIAELAGRDYEGVIKVVKTYSNIIE